MISTLLLMAFCLGIAFWALFAWIYTLTVLIEADVHPGLFGHISGVFERITSKAYGEDYIWWILGGVLAAPLLIPVAIVTSFMFFLENLFVNKNK